MTQVTSEKQYLEKANRHLENILEATHAYKTREVSELNRIHVETIKVSKPTKLNLCQFATIKFLRLNDFLILFMQTIAHLRFSPRPQKHTTNGRASPPCPARNTLTGARMAGRTSGVSCRRPTWQRWPWLKNYDKCRYRWSKIIGECEKKIQQVPLTMFAGASQPRADTAEWGRDEEQQAGAANRKAGRADICLIATVWPQRRGSGSLY